MLVNPFYPEYYIVKKADEGDLDKLRSVIVSGSEKEANAARLIIGRYWYLAGSKEQGVAEIDKAMATDRLDANMQLYGMLWKYDAYVDSKQFDKAMTLTGGIDRMAYLAEFERVMKIYCLQADIPLASGEQIGRCYLKKMQQPEKKQIAVVAPVVKPAPATATVAPSPAVGGNVADMPKLKQKQTEKPAEKTPQDNASKQTPAAVVTIPAAVAVVPPVVVAKPDNATMAKQLYGTKPTGTIKLYIQGGSFTNAYSRGIMYGIEREKLDIRMSMGTTPPADADVVVDVTDGAISANGKRIIVGQQVNVQADAVMMYARAEGIITMIIGYDKQREKLAYVLKERMEKMNRSVKMLPIEEVRLQERLRQAVETRGAKRTAIVGLGTETSLINLIPFAKGYTNGDSIRLAAWVEALTPHFFEGDMASYIEGMNVITSIRLDTFGEDEFRIQYKKIYGENANANAFIGYDIAMLANHILRRTEGDPLPALFSDIEQVTETNVVRNPQVLRVTGKMAKPIAYKNQ